MAGSDGIYYHYLLEESVIAFFAGRRNHPFKAGHQVKSN